MAAKFPPRLHVLLAARARYGLILRRGPSKQVCTIGWNRNKDTFEVGQWMKGAIYEHRCDISSDGQHWIYFVLKGNWSAEVGGTFTALARSPFVKALTLWPNGSTWGGGGYFTPKGTYCVYGGGPTLFDAKEVRCEEGFHPQVTFGGQRLGGYFAKLVRDGWRVVEVRERQPGGWASCVVLEKDLPRGWVLRKFARTSINPDPGRKVEFDQHELEHSKARAKILCPDWEWADEDGSSLVWAEKGCLWRGTVGRSGLEKWLLKDFNEMTFEAIKAPY